MNGFEITELGQVREQENMLARAEAQAMRRARRDHRREPGEKPRPAEPMPEWLAAFLYGKRAPGRGQGRARMSSASDPACR